MNAPAENLDHIEKTLLPTQVQELLKTYNVAPRHVRQVLDAMLYNGDPLQSYRQDDAAAILGVSTRTLCRERADGTGPKFVLVRGGVPVYPRKYLLEYLENRAIKSHSEAQAPRAVR